MNKELIVERYKNPKYQGKLEGMKGFASNTSCGDDVEVYFKIEKGLILDCKFQSSACSICVACADLIIEKIIGMKIEDASNISEELVLNMIDLEKSSPRKRCATLPLEAVKSVLNDVK